MQKQELIDRLLDCSRTLQELAEHLRQTELPAPAPADTTAPADSADASPAAEDKADDAPPAAKPPAAEPAKNSNPLARLLAGYTPPKFELPGGGNPLQLFNLFGGRLPGGAGGGNLPSTLAELHDNPEILSMLDRVAADPQSLSALSALTGQDPQRLQAVLQSLTPPATAPAVTVPAAIPAEAPLSAAAPPVSDATAHLNSLLAEWHWQPYARVWQS